MINKESEREKIFRQVFQDIEFPFLALDLKKISDGITSKQKLSSYFGFDNNSKEKKSDAIRGAFRGLVKNIEPPSYIFDLLKESQFLKDKFVAGKSIKSQIESDYNNFAVYTKDDKLIWEEESFWPLSYSTFLQQLLNITTLYQIALDKREKELRDVIRNRMQVQISPEYPRFMPTVIHYAYASLGAWIGGASSVQFFSLYASAPQIKKDETNKKYSVSIGYTEEEAKELTTSGIISIPASLAFPLFQAQGQGTMLGSLPLEEFNAVNLPPKESIKTDPKSHFEKTKLAGFIIDKYYRTPFLARKLVEESLYGPKNVLRDHYTDFYNSLSFNQTLRCKHYCAPIIEINTTDELHGIISKIPSRGKGGLFFRGQTSFYPLKRTKAVKKLLFGSSSSKEPSLLSAAARTNYDYDKLHFTLKYFLGQELIANDKKSSKLLEKWNELSVSPDCRYDLAIMALAQHYGFPTNGLDVTTSIQVALWFATNKYVCDENGISRYVKMKPEEWPKEKENWPILYIFQTVLNSSYGSLQDCNEVSELGIKALRPERQQAKFFLGGHGDHQNRLAESMVCAVRLPPLDYKLDVDFDYLFPNPETDVAYKLLLELSKNKLFSDSVGSKINIFH